MNLTGTAYEASQQSNRVKIRALRNYQAQETDELSFNAGDIFERIKEEDDGGWCLGHKSGKTGLYPGKYGEVVNADEGEYEISRKLTKIYDLRMFFTFIF